MIKSAIVAIVFVAVTASHADAKRRRSFEGSSSSFSSNGTFGLGLEIGAPTGLNGKYFLSDNTALNFGVGYLYDHYWHDRDGLHLYLDFLWHPVTLVDADSFQMPLYFGIGGRIWNFDHRDRNAFAIGARVPVGIAFDFHEVPIDIFIQLTFVVDLLINHDDRASLHLESSAGIRYWFF